MKKLEEKIKDLLEVDSALTVLEIREKTGSDLQCIRLAMQKLSRKEERYGIKETKGHVIYKK